MDIFRLNSVCDLTKETEPKSMCKYPYPLFEPEATAFSLRESFARRHGRVGDFLPNDRSRAPKVQGGVNGYLSVM